MVSEMYRNNVIEREEQFIGQKLFTWRLWSQIGKIKWGFQKLFLEVISEEDE